MQSDKNIYCFGDLVPHLQQKKQYFYFSSTAANLKDVFSNGRSDNCTQKSRLCARSIWLQIQFYSTSSWRQLCTKICLLEYDAMKSGRCTDVSDEPASAINTVYIMEAAEFPDISFHFYQVTRRHILHHNNHSHPRVHLKSYINTQVYCAFPAFPFRPASLPEPNGVCVSPDKRTLTKYGKTDQIRSLDRTVDIVPRLRAGRSRVWIPIRARHVSSPKRPQRLSGPPSLLFNENHRLFPQG